MQRRSNNILRIISWFFIGLFVFYPSFSYAEHHAKRAKRLKTTQTQKLTIRNIEIQVRDVFDDPDSGYFYKTANRLKISSRESVIRRELIFKSGEPYDKFVVDESLRNLRRLSFVRDPRIITNVDGDHIDIVVSVQDTWTLFPQIGWSSGGGDNKTSIGIAESNLLGYGKRLELLYAKDDGIKNQQAVYEDDLFLGSRDRLLLGQFLRSDGYRSVASFGRPFRSLVEPSAWVINGEGFDLVEKLYQDGDERYIFRQKHFDINGGYTISKGTADELLRRYTFGYDFQQDTFSPADEDDYKDVDVDPNDVSHDPNLLAEDRRFSGPFVSYRQIKPEYISLNYIDRFDRVQDFNLGQELFVKSGYAPEALGSASNNVFFAFSASEGRKFSDTAFIRGGLGGSTRIEPDYVQNTILQAESKYYNVLGERCFLGVPIGRHTLASSFLALYSADLDKDQEFLLGATTGLRGYKSRTFTGDSLMLLNLEDRFYLVDDVLKLFSVGGAFFADIGGTSTEGLGDIIKDRLYADVGYGLRIGFPRASGGTVWRIDVAYPLRDGPDGSNQGEPRFLFTIGQVFSGNLRTEAPDAKQAKADIGF